MPHENWRKCAKCGTLWFSDGSNVGLCISKNGSEGHDYQNSKQYLIPLSDEIRGDGELRRCKKCQALVRRGVSHTEKCFGGGEHDVQFQEQVEYVLDLARIRTTDSKVVEEGWTMCTQCRMIYFKAIPGGGACPNSNGGPHAFGTSNDYVVPFQI